MMTHDERFFDFIGDFVSFVEEEHEEIFFSFLEENFTVYEIIAWYVEYKGDE